MVRHRMFGKRIKAHACTRNVRGMRQEPYGSGEGGRLAENKPRPALTDPTTGPVPFGMLQIGMRIIGPVHTRRLGQKGDATAFDGVGALTRRSRPVPLGEIPDVGRMARVLWHT